MQWKAAGQEGPFYARKMLEKLGFENPISKRICYLVGHHHTYTDIDGIDYQILVEADFLVNFYEDDLGQDAINAAFTEDFSDRSGKNTVQALLFQKLRKIAMEGEKTHSNFINQSALRLYSKSISDYDPAYRLNIHKLAIRRLLCTL